LEIRTDKKVCIRSEMFGRRSTRKSKLPRYFTTECKGVPEWMLKRAAPNSVSLSSSASVTPVNTENITDNSHENMTPFPFVLPIDPNNPSSVPTRSLTSVSHEFDQMISVERLPDASTKTDATDFGHHEENEERQLRQSEQDFPNLSGLLANVEDLGVKPNPSRRRRRINVATVTTTLSGRPLPNRRRYPRQTIYARIGLKRQQMDDYPESDAQLAELTAVNSDIHETEREIIRYEKDNSVLEGLIAEVEAKMARKRFLDFENWLESEVYSTGHRTEEFDETNVFPSPTPSELCSAQHEIDDWMIDGIPTFDVEE